MPTYESYILWSNKLLQNLVASGNIYYLSVPVGGETGCGLARSSTLWLTVFFFSQGLYEGNGWDYGLTAKAYASEVTQVVFGRIQFLWVTGLRALVSPCWPETALSYQPHRKSSGQGSSQHVAGYSQTSEWEQVNKKDVPASCCLILWQIFHQLCFILFVVTEFLGVTNTQGLGIIQEYIKRWRWLGVILETAYYTALQNLLEIQWANTVYVKCLE